MVLLGILNIADGKLPESCRVCALPPPVPAGCRAYEQQALDAETLRVLHARDTLQAYQTPG
jgi:hypothetical protein